MARVFQKTVVWCLPDSALLYLNLMISWTTLCSSAFDSFASVLIYSAVAPSSRRKCDNAGEVPVAFAVRAPGSTISEEEVKQYIAQQVDLDPFLIFLILFYFAHFITLSSNATGVSFGSVSLSQGKCT